MDPTNPDEEVPGETTSLEAAGPAAPSTEAGGGSERGLLLGLLAAQVGLVRREELLDAVRDWAGSRPRDLGDVLRGRGALDGDRLELLRSLARATLEQHGGDPSRAVASLDPPGSTLLALRRAAGEAGPAARDGDEPGPTADGHPDLGATVDAPTTGSADEAPHRSSRGRHGRYRVLQFHAKGGLGKVSVALDDELDRRVALKEIREDLADSAESRLSFVYEAEVTGRLDHPGVVPVYGFGRDDDGRPYYAMRFIRGRTLEDAIAEFHGPSGPEGRGPRALGLRGLLRRFVDICNAVEYAHSRGVIHRDLKPKNVMLGPHGETLVVDWGLAKPVGRPEGAAPAEAEGTIRPSSGSDYAASRYGQIKGTLAYMSPEQAEGRVDELGPACDVYALGVILYGVLTGRRAFQGLSRDELLPRVIAGEFPAPRAISPTVPRPLEAICLRAMRLRAGDRYDSVQAMADDVERWLADEPVSAYREPPPARAARWLRHHRTAAVAAGVLLVVATAALAIDDVRVTRERTETARALGLVEKEFARAESERGRAESERKAAVNERARAVVARDRARSNFAIARAAVDRMTKVVAGPALAGNAEEDRLRYDLAVVTLDLDEKLLEAAPNDRPTRLRAARSAHVAGRLGGQADRFEESLKHFQRSASLLDGLAKLVPDEPGYRIELAQTLGARGEVYRMNGKVRDAESSYRQAMIALGALSERAQADRARVLAMTRNDLAALLTWRGNYPSARREADDAIRALEPLARASDADGLLLVLARTTLGGVAREAKDRRAAAEALGAAVDLGRRLLDKNGGAGKPETRDFQVFFAAARSEQGALLAEDAATRDSALRALDEAIDLLDPLVALFPQFRAYGRELAVALDRRGDALLAAGKPDRARPDLDRARGLLEALVRAKDHPDDHSHLGRNLGHLAKAEPDREKAARLLERAIDEQNAALAVYTESLIDRGLLREHTDALGALRRPGRP